MCWPSPSASLDVDAYDTDDRRNIVTIMDTCIDYCHNTAIIVMSLQRTKSDNTNNNDDDGDGLSYGNINGDFKNRRRHLTLSLH